jgi:purine-binding chemotaxis protein CheW
MTDQYLIFLLGGMLFGVRLDGAVEIVPWRQARKVPRAYSYVEGILDYRGTIYPIFDPAPALELRAAPGSIGFTAEEHRRGPRESIIFLRAGDAPFGISVDKVVKMMRVDEVLPPPDESVVKSHYVKGLAYDEGQEIVILDFERLLFHGR